MNLICITKTKMSRNIYFFSNPKLYVYIYYVNFIAFFYRIWFSFFPLPTVQIPKDDTQIYIEKQTERFLKNFPKTEEDRKKGNANIDKRCYSLESFAELIKEETNELEPEWKRRIMMESTPRGNIIMYYDIYKQAFAYVSDQHMNYPILNACAMKYVQTYFCVDFFLDGNILPEGVVSPFILLQEESEKREKEKQTEKKRDLGIQFHNAPFAKLKTYYGIKEIISEKKIIHSEKTKTDPLPSNIFRYLGKISNLSLLQKIKKPVLINSKINCSLESFDYLAYKNRFKNEYFEEKEEKLEEEKKDHITELDLDYDSTSTVE